jgi:addiction module HigA family antidote
MSMARKRNLQPANPIHPGEMLLEEFLRPAGKTQTAFAREIGWTRARLNEFIKGKRGVTAEAALDLAEALGTSPRLWMNMQATFDLDEATRKRRAA